MTKTETQKDRDTERQRNRKSFDASSLCQPADERLSTVQPITTKKLRSSSSFFFAFKFSDYSKKISFIQTLA
jgi:hypothetical protein